MQEQLIRKRAPRSAYELVFATVQSAGPLFRTSEAVACGQVLGMSQTASYQQLGAAARGGIVERLRGGLYLAAPPLRSHEPHEFLIATRAVHGSAIAGVSALSFWGLIDQIPMRLVTAVVSRGIVVQRSADSESDALLPAGLDIRGLRYVYRRITTVEMIGVAQTPVDDETVVPMFDRERTVLDSIIHPRTYGGTTGPYILSEHRDDLDDRRLRDYARQLRASAALERVSHGLGALAL